jgi:hypothetical protein
MIEQRSIDARYLTAKRGLLSPNVNEPGRVSIEKATVLNHGKSVFYLVKKIKASRVVLKQA